MIEVEFNNANFNVVKQNWETWLDKGWHPGVAIDYDERMGKGILFLLELEKGLTVVMGDNIAKDDVAFINTAYKTENNSLFTLNYLVMGDVYITEDKNQQEAPKHYMLNKVVLHHSKSNFSFVAQKGKRSRVLDIIFSHEWLLNQYSFSQRNIINENISKVESLRSFYIDPISASSFEFVRDILDKVFYSEWDYIFLKPRIISLIEESVKNYLLPKNNVHEKLTAGEDILTMIAIKQKINATLYEKLPNRKTLAKEFFMSESTLDRRFRQSFGKTINEYHLEEKMELARRILRRDEYSISQIAYLLGYETASAFIKSFKKHFGVSPGSLRKETLIDGEREI